MDSVQRAVETAATASAGGNHWPLIMLTTMVCVACLVYLADKAWWHSKRWQSAKDGGEAIPAIYKSAASTNANLERLDRHLAKTATALESMASNQTTQAEAHRVVAARVDEMDRKLDVITTVCTVNRERLAQLLNGARDD